MSRIFSTGRDENLENAVGQPLVKLEQLAATLNGKKMVRTASNKRTKRAGVEEQQMIQEAVDRILKNKEDEACMAGGDGMEPEACGTISVRPRTPKASIDTFGITKDGFRMPTAEYLERCAEEGDEKSYQKALEIRSAAINAFVKKAETEERMRIEAAAREDWRKIVAENLEDDEVEAETEDEEKKEAEAETDDEVEEKEASSKISFKKASSLAENEKIILASRLVSLGFSEDVARTYVFEKLAPRYTVPSHIEQLAKSNLEKEAKTAIFKGFVREAKLEEKDRRHLLDYWSKVLGYQDKEWCSDLVKDVDPVTGD